MGFSAEPSLRTWGVPSAPRAALLLHGYGQTADFVAPLAEALAARGNVYVVAPDLRGHGDGPDLAPGPADPQFIADAVALHAAHIGRPCAWFGNSLGGRIAALTVSAHPTLATRLVLGECIAGLERVFALMRVGMRRQGSRLPDTFASRDEARTQAEQILRLRGASLDRFLEHGLRPLPDGRFRHTLRLAVLEPERWPELGDAVPAALRAIDGTVHVVFGGASSVLTTEQQQAVAACFADPRVEVIPGAGHDLPLDAPVRLAEILLD